MREIIEDAAAIVSIGLFVSMVLCWSAILTSLVVW